MDYDFIVAMKVLEEDDADFTVKVGGEEGIAASRVKLSVDIICDGREEIYKDYPDWLASKDYDLITTVYPADDLAGLVYYNIQANEAGILWFIDRLLDLANLMGESDSPRYLHMVRLILQIAREADQLRLTILRDLASELLDTR